MAISKNLDFPISSSHLPMIKCIPTATNRRKAASLSIFINKVDSLYDPSIKQVFIVLDNASIHRSKKTREAMKKHSRIVLVFLPTKAPELNLDAEDGHQQQYI
jgi:hypothetical protein